MGKNFWGIDFWKIPLTPDGKQCFWKTVRRFNF